jgi:ATP-dependent Lon protease
LIDSTQNSQFHDKYFSELDFDLSKCLFVFSYNDERLVNPILKDRMTVLEIPGYTKEDKVSIARDYLIPQMSQEYNMSIDWTNRLIEHAIEKTDKESGVRNLKRSLDTIYSKLNLIRILEPEKSCNLTEEKLEEWFPASHPPTYSNMYL